ncbi:putative reverse transcriptase domain-containing protein [Tanacetum coccineum]|uniref:Reverse transcriptase domain-containing protein n=1 Tax=Tanacetum coccineum TaxID=301880 RepID=A0ABQ5IH17_9ASTR
MEHDLWNLKVKEYNIVAYTQRFNELALMCPRMVKPESVKVDAYIRGLTDNIKGEVTSSKPANLNKVVRMAYKLMEQKSQARDERILEGKKRKWESFQSRNSSGKRNHKENSRQTSQNNQKQGNAQAMITAPTDGKVSSGSLPVCEHCFTRHIGPCTIKCHKCGKVGHKARHCNKKNVATGANAQPILTCYDCGEQGHTRNLCPKKIKQEEVGEVRGRAYAIKDAEPLSEPIFEIDLMPIELGTFDVIISMDWLVKHDAVIVYGEKVVRIPYETQYDCIVESRTKVFPEELLRLPPLRQVEFRIDLVTGRWALDALCTLFIDDILVYSKDEEEHERHLKIILEFLKNERLYAKFSKCDFWLDAVQFLSNVIDRCGVHVDPTKIEAIKN